MNLFCCKILADHILAGGSRGFAIIPFKISEQPNVTDFVFFLQFRSADMDDLTSKLIVGDIAIKYCPWCGTMLSENLMKNKDVISEIALKNRRLIEFRGF